ncbi:MAG: TIGR03790 family protein, partial [Kiritimatiellae bacterium]|nr:TIGR03790 family protein [Kiritimatiellia bacterium]
VMASLFPRVSLALGPHELLVLANGKSKESVEIARRYMSLRGIPDENLVYVPVPGENSHAISRDDFTRFIWEPALKGMRKHGVEDRILAWAYSTDFPVMIKTAPPMSIQGVTFVRNRIPVAEQVQNGKFSSPLFAGPNGHGKLVHYSQTFDVYERWLDDEMPLPSMMLGVTGERGNSKKEVLECLERGLASDHTAPKGTIYFVKSGDVRSTCRAWQFPMAHQALSKLSVKSVIVDRFPESKKNVMGMLVGAAQVNPGVAGHYLLGAMAEHLTSAAGVFNSSHQTKLTAWISAGASGSAGTVTEPFSIWTKFPNAYFYVHYAGGCTMIESFFQSIRSPLQILLVGDPLASPWKPDDSLVIKGLKNDKLQTKFIVTADVKSRLGFYPRFLFLLDDLVVGRGKTFDLDVSRLKDGEHKLRVVGYSTGLVANQVFAEKKFLVDKGMYVGEQ